MMKADWYKLVSGKFEFEGSDFLPALVASSASIMELALDSENYCDTATDGKSVFLMLKLFAPPVSDWNICADWHLQTLTGQNWLNMDISCDPADLPISSSSSKHKQSGRCNMMKADWYKLVSGKFEFEGSDFLPAL
eukprot:scaffold8771_cov67-Skeletonema_dohrnii-CCMP3373.AAC.1